MQKLFTLLRQGNIEELKRILAEKPEEISSKSGATPKKDQGQSLLQVALKTGQLEIAEYLLEVGIDVNFMEEEDDDPGLRVPVLFDAVTATTDSLCANQFSTPDEVKEKFNNSDRAFAIFRSMVSRGADVNKRTSNGMSIINWSLHHAETIMERRSAYPFSQEKIREQLTLLLDFLFKNGADYTEWMNEGYYPGTASEYSVKAMFFEQPRPETQFIFEKNKEIRELLQNFFGVYKYFDFSQITKIENEQVYYCEEGTEQAISLVDSADIWYDTNHKDSFADKLFGKRKKNQYAGIKSFVTKGTAYINLYGKNCEYCFTMHVNENNLIDKRKEWDELNTKLNNQGYSLLDWK